MYSKDTKKLSSLYNTRSKSIFLILLDRKVCQLSFLKCFKESVNWIHIGFIIFSDLRSNDYIKECCKVLFFFWSLIKDISDKSNIVELFGFYPKIFTRFFSLTFGIFNNCLNQFQNIFFRTNIGKRIVFHGFFEVDGV